MACYQGKYSYSKTAMTPRHQHDVGGQHDHRGLYCLKHVGPDHTGLELLNIAGPELCTPSLLNILSPYSPEKTNYDFAC